MPVIRDNHEWSYPEWFIFFPTGQAPRPPSEGREGGLAGLLAQLGDLDGAFATLEASRRANGRFAAPGRFPGLAQPFNSRDALSNSPRLTVLLGDRLAIADALTGHTAS